MSIVYDDPKLREMLNDAQLQALGRLRKLALLMHCRTARDSAAMTAANILPLGIKEYGVEWGRLELLRILRLLTGYSSDKRHVRRAAHYLFQIL